VNTTPIRIELTPAERNELSGRARGQRLAHRDVVRATIVLMLADRQSVSSVARQVGKTRKIVRKWGERFVKRRLEGLCDKPGRGREPLFSPGRCNASGEAGVRAA
jgi:Winged helix-turn helix